MIPVGPFAAFGLIALGAHRSKGLSQGLAIAGIVIAVVLSQLVFLGVVIDPTPERVPVANWYTLGTERAVLSTQVDPTDAIMVAMVSFVCLLIFVYSLGYMEADRRSSRYFAYVSLFAGAMLGAKRLPAKWIAPLRDTFYGQIIGYHPIAVSECARRSLEIAKRFQLAS